MRARFIGEPGLKAGLRGSRLAALIAALVASSCDTLVPDLPLVFFDDRIPLINLNLPRPLAETSSVNATFNPLPKASGQHQEARNVFAPFRHSLATASRMIKMANGIIRQLNEAPVPDNLDAVNDLGQRIVITIDDARQYSKRIEIYTPGGVKFMQVNYNKGIDQVLVLFEPAVFDTTAGVNNIGILYDAITQDRSLTCSMVFSPDYDPADRRVYPKRLFVNVTGAGAQVTTQGGVVYNFVFGDTSAAALNPAIYTADHAYMYQAWVDTVNDMALVNLFFPPATVNSVDLAGHEMGAVYLDILTTWVNYPENTEVRGNLDNLVTGIPDSSFAYATSGGLLRMLEFIDANQTGGGLDGLLFMLRLANPIAYDATVGYVAHGDSVSLTYKAVGNPTSVDFTLTPLEISELAVGFLPD